MNLDALDNLPLETLAWLGAGLFTVGLAASLLLASARGGPARTALNCYSALLNREIRAQFLTTTPRRIIAGQVGFGLAAAALAAGYDSRFALLLPVIVVAPRFWLIVEGRKRKVKIDEQMNGWLAMMANMLKVTGSLSDAIEHAAALTRAPLGQELDLLLKEIRVGVPLPDALRNMGARVDTAMMSTAVSILLIGRGTGGELPRLLEETSATFRERLRLEGVVRKQTAMGRMQLTVLVFGPPVIIWMFRKVEPGYFDPLFNSGFLGHFITAMIVSFWIFSLIIARKILDVDV